MSNSKNHAPISAVVVGCGERGFSAYGAYAAQNPHRLKLIACAEPDPEKRKRFAGLHKIPDDKAFESDIDLLSAGKLADAIFICTMDQFHDRELIPALELGYHVFLEKPMAITETACRRIVEKTEEVGKVLAVGHVLRYSPLFTKVRAILDSGAIGNVVNIKHSENMGTWVYAHSFVRGNWENSGKTSPFILQKGCHDFDLIYWFSGSIPTKVSSFAMPSPLRPENAPAGAPARCTDGCPHSESCIYEAQRFYLQGKFVMQDNARSDKQWVRQTIKLGLKHPRLATALIPALKNKYHIIPWRLWPTSQLSNDLNDEGIIKALKEGPFGRCVYHCNNDQPVSQVTSIEFESGATATYTLHGMSYKDGRELRIDGTKGSIKTNFYNTGFFLESYDHISGTTKKYKLALEKVPGGGGDTYIVDGFLNAINGIAPPLTTARESLYSHLMAFAADRSAKDGIVERIT